MAISSTRAQDAIGCLLCDMPSQQFCNNCQINLCVDCISIHVDTFKSVSHDIVHLKNKTTRLKYCECKFHYGQLCEANCQSCHTPVCIECLLSDLHRDHNVIKLIKIVEEKRQEIEKETEEIETKIIPKYKTTNTIIEDKALKVTSECAKTESETEKLRDIWHQEVDAIFNKVGSVAQFFKDYKLAALTTEQSKIKKLVQDSIHTVSQNKQLLSSNNPYEVANFKSTVNQNRDISIDFGISFPDLKSNIVHGSNLSMEFGGIRAMLTLISQSDNLASDMHFLTTKELRSKAKISVSIPTGCKPLYRVVCVGSNEAFVSGNDKSITRIDIHGITLDMVTTDCQVRPNGISVNCHGELLYSNCDNRTVNLVRYGQAKVLMTLPIEWSPYSLCCTKSENILVHASSIERNKIIKYQGQNVTQDIDKDNQGISIFQNGKFTLNMAENNNGDICVSDVNAERIVVIDPTGRVRFRYDGTHAKRKRKFSPRCIVTDSLNQILTTDVNNCCVHILDQNGKFLKCLDNSDLKVPIGLSIDCKGRLWVGLLERGKIKVLEYLK
ncbi:uncharacterized protein LOC128161759 [Crassostrea angulata]|uniref:uncharacterized protein LOC128161759 n=1 Tax=Magallana angulata TaxID=2784310 RepID=UPI0022B0F041|nr:uncharacterized protein LOC128161759 [Crassostrea angulata]